MEEVVKVIIFKRVLMVYSELMLLLVECWKVLWFLNFIWFDLSDKLNYIFGERK